MKFRVSLKVVSSIKETNEKFWKVEEHLIVDELY
jgi:hypothetical protein